MSGSHDIRCEGNTIYFRVRGNVDVSDVQVLFEHGTRLAAQYGQFWVLVYAQEMTTISTEARRTAVKNPNLKCLGGGAVVGANLANRTILTLINRAMNLLGGVRVKSAFVQTEEEAKAWLSEQRAKPASS